VVPGGVHLFITDDDWQWMMNIDALGTMHMMQAAATRMRDTGGGNIVNVASIAAKGYRQTSKAAYAASKGAVLALTRALRDSGQRGVPRAYVIAPAQRPRPAGDTRPHRGDGQRRAAQEVQRTR
jgi:NAD(P)-dependent dehydrogenase (short-subunit alcohol dehydrogenase family)